MCHEKPYGKRPTYFSSFKLLGLLFGERHTVLASRRDDCGVYPTATWYYHKNADGYTIQSTNLTDPGVVSDFRILFWLIPASFTQLREISTKQNVQYSYTEVVVLCQLMSGEYDMFDLISALNCFMHRLHHQWNLQ